MKASDIMSRTVITVSPDTSLHEVIEVLLRHRISGVLVMEDNKVVGILGDGDLLHRHEIGTDHWTEYRTWWQRLTRLSPGPAEYVRAHGGHARDVMTLDIVSVGEEASLGEIASIFEERRVRRIPVTTNGVLKGLITRSDLVRAIAQCNNSPQEAARVAASDEEIHQQLLTELAMQPWWSSAWSSVYVQNGVVSYFGVMRQEADREAARVAAENIPGVLKVEDQRLRFVDFQAGF